VSRQQTVNRIVLAISIVSYAFFMLLTFERKTVFYAPRVQWCTTTLGQNGRVLTTSFPWKTLVTSYVSDSITDAIHFCYEIEFSDAFLGVHGYVGE